MARSLALALVLALASPGLGRAEEAASLRGSRASMIEQNRVAKEHDLAFLRTAGQIREAVRRGELVPLAGDVNYEVADFVEFPYLQPEAALFVERLAAQYREACGQKLVVTSAVRPTTGQPANAHALSVHPAGMAVDLRVSDRAACRAWLEMAILNLETRGVLNGVREYRPPHYHIAVYPSEYFAYAQERIAIEEREAAVAAADRASATRHLDPLANVAAAGLLEAEPAPSAAEAVRTLRLILGLGVVLLVGYAAKRRADRQW